MAFCSQICEMNDTINKQKDDIFCDIIIPLILSGSQSAQFEQVHGEADRLSLHLRSHRAEQRADEAHHPGGKTV